MKHSLAVAAIAAFAFGAVHAADTPAPADKNALAAADKAADTKKAAAKKTDAAKTESAKAAAPASAPAAAATGGSGLEAKSARERPATGITPMTGTRGMARSAPAADKPADAAVKPAGDAAPAPPKQ